MKNTWVVAEQYTDLQNQINMALKAIDETVACLDKAQMPVAETIKNVLDKINELEYFVSTEIAVRSEGVKHWIRLISGVPHGGHTKRTFVFDNQHWQRTAYKEQLLIVQALPWLLDKFNENIHKEHNATLLDFEVEHRSNKMTNWIKNKLMKSEPKI